MANAKTTKKTADQTKTDVQPLQETTGNPDITSATQEQSEGGKKELPVQSEQSGGEQTDGEGDTTLGTESENESAEEKGSGTVDPVTDEETESEDDVYQEAKEVIGKMVDEAIDNSGILDEPKGTTEKRNRIAADVFEKNADCKTLYFTADMIPFFVKSDAFRHGAGTLKNDTIVTINRK